MTDQTRRKFLQLGVATVASALILPAVPKLTAAPADAMGVDPMGWSGMDYASVEARLLAYYQDDAKVGAGRWADELDGWKTLLFTGGRGAGKTWRQLDVLAKLMHKYPGVTCLVGGSTWPLIGRLQQMLIEALARTSGADDALRQWTRAVRPYQNMRLENGSRASFVNTGERDWVERQRGIQLNVVLLDDPWLSYSPWRTREPYWRDWETTNYAIAHARQLARWPFRTFGEVPDVRLNARQPAGVRLHDGACITHFEPRVISCLPTSEYMAPRPGEKIVSLKPVNHWELWTKQTAEWRKLTSEGAWEDEA